MILKEKTEFLQKNNVKTHLCLEKEFCEKDILKALSLYFEKSQTIDPEFNQLVSEQFWNLLME